MMCLFWGVCSNEVGGNLGWINAERNGVIDAIRTLTHNRSAREDEDGMGGLPDEDEEDERDGRFGCEVCGRNEWVAPSPQAHQGR